MKSEEVCLCLFINRKNIARINNEQKIDADAIKISELEKSCGMSIYYNNVFIYL